MKRGCVIKWLRVSCRNNMNFLYNPVKNDPRLDGKWDTTRLDLPTRQLITWVLNSKDFHWTLGFYWAKMPRLFTLNLNPLLSRMRLSGKVKVLTKQSFRAECYTQRVFKRFVWKHFMHPNKLTLQFKFSHKILRSPCTLGNSVLLSFSFVL